jgi:ComF family protein
MIFAPVFPGLMRRAIRFLLPVDCAACGTPLTNDPVPLFCSACWNTIRQSSHPRCARCDRPFASPVAMSYSPKHVCQACAERAPAFTRAWTLYPYLPPLQDAICLFKYRGRISLAGPLSRLMIEVIPSSLRADLIMPVPLHPHRLREREFNQSLLLADRVGRYLRLPVASANLVRMAPSPPQTSLSRQERLRNLRGAFGVRRPHQIDGKRILLIDDVFTTGATVHECAKTLRKAGSGDVFAVTLARTTEASTVPDRILAQQTRQGVELLGG